MIARLTGRLVEVTENSAMLDIGGVVYEALVPAYLGPVLRSRLAAGPKEVTLHTLHYIDGGVGGSTMCPRLIGFLDSEERDFFTVFTTVKGVGNRKALRAMVEEPAVIAGYIEQADPRALSRLPEIGKRTAEKMIAELRGKLEDFALESRAGVAEPSFKDEAVEALMNALQFTRSEAEERVEKALERDGSIDTVEELIRNTFSKPGA